MNKARSGNKTTKNKRNTKKILNKFVATAYQKVLTQNNVEVKNQENPTFL